MLAGGNSCRKEAWDISETWALHSAISTLARAECAETGRLLSLPKKEDRKDPWKPFCSYERELLHPYSCVYFPIAPSDTGEHGGPPAALKIGKVAETLVPGERYQDQAPSGR